MGFDGIIPEFLFKFKVDISMGGAMILRVGIYKYYCKRSEQKNFGGCTPTYDIGYNSCKETYGEPMGLRYPGICFLYTDPSFIGL